MRFLNKNLQKKIILMATPSHGNLGDNAIVYAEIKFLLDCGYNKTQIVEIKKSDFFRHKNEIKNNINDDDVIIIDGGGNLGTLWKNEDDKISYIIKEYSSNNIIVFPQTIYYDNTIEAYARLMYNNSLYKKCPNLTISFRDKNSYEFAKHNFENINILYAPDIVLYLDKTNIREKREGVLLCFRNDNEKNISNQTLLKLIKDIEESNKKYRFTDTVISDYKIKLGRNSALNRKWKEFSSSEIVITDRLHAMLFSAITNTPCIAYDNKSKKVSGVYKWINHLGFIKCIDSKDNARDIINEVIDSKDKYSSLKKEFNCLKEKVINV